MLMIVEQTNPSPASPRGEELKPTLHPSIDLEPQRPSTEQKQKNTLSRGRGASHQFISTKVG